MSIELTTIWILSVMLLTVRLGIVFYSTPLYSYAPVPAQVKVVFVVALSAILLLGAAPSSNGLILKPAFLLKGVLAEVLIGMVLAFSVQIVFAAFQWGGRVMDMQMGFSVANLIDPSTRTQAPMMGTILSAAALMLFYALDGHHLLMKGLAFSIRAVPPGSIVSLDDPMLIVGQFGMIFTYGLMAVAPVVFALTMIDMVIAVAARTMPQMNVFFVGLPIKIFVGLLVFATTVRFMMPFMEKVFKTMFMNWHLVLAG